MISTVGPIFKKSVEIGLISLVLGYLKRTESSAPFFKIKNVPLIRDDKEVSM